MAAAVQEGENGQERVKSTSYLIQREDLQPGDHIYVYRKQGMYALRWQEQSRRTNGDSFH